MKIGVVTGSVWATKKSPDLTGQSLLRVQIGQQEWIATDLVGAGERDRVIVAFGGAARQLSGDLPMDAAILAILDDMEEVP